MGYDLVMRFRSVATGQALMWVGFAASEVIISAPPNTSLLR
jgi:hypothetical protein